MVIKKLFLVTVLLAVLGCNDQNDEDLSSIKEMDLTGVWYLTHIGQTYDRESLEQQYVTKDREYYIIKESEQGTYFSTCEQFMGIYNYPDDAHGFAFKTDDKFYLGQFGDLSLNESDVFISHDRVANIQTHWGTGEKWETQTGSNITIGHVELSKRSGEFDLDYGRFSLTGIESLSVNESLCYREYINKWGDAGFSIAVAIGDDSAVFSFNLSSAFEEKTYYFDESKNSDENDLGLTILSDSPRFQRQDQVDFMIPATAELTLTSVEEFRLAGDYSLEDFEGNIFTGSFDVVR